MSGLTPHKRRGFQALISFALALGLLVLGAGVVWQDARLGHAPDVSGPVAPGWSDQAADAASSGSSSDCWEGRACAIGGGRAGRPTPSR